MVGDVNAAPSDKSWSHYINTAAFAIPAQYTYGNLGRDRMRTDPFYNLDFSIFRAFPITERFRAELRAEAFNILNHPIYGIPNANVGRPGKLWPHDFDRESCPPDAVGRQAYLVTMLF